MCPSGKVLETIKVEDRQLQNIHWHNERFNQARTSLFGINKYLKLEDIIKIPKTLSNDVYKCRVIYTQHIEKIEFEKYTPRKIQSLKLIEANDIDYSNKYYDRRKIEDLFKQKENGDDILIIKNSLVTDTSFANIVFWDGKRWITPSTPLLKGTTRARLLSEGKISEVLISRDDLGKFKKARIINAMNDLGETPDISRFIY